MKAIKLFTLFILVQFNSSFAQNTSNEKIKADIKKNTQAVSKKAAKNVEYVARESGKNIKTISEKTAVGVEKTVRKIDADVKKKKAAKGN